MTSKRITSNQREGLSVADSITGNQFYVKGNSSDGSINVSITSGGAGGTQYAEGTTTAPATGTVALGRYNTVPPTLTNGQLNAPQLDVNGNLKVNIASGGGSGGTSSSFGSAFPATGTAVGATDGTNMQALKVDGSNNLLTKINVALPAGANVIGHVITDTGSTTAVTGTVAVTQSTSPWIVAGGGTAGSAATGVVTVQGIASMTKLLVTPDSVALPANQSVNVSQINGVTPLMGNGVTGTGSQRVTIASDNTAFSVNATLSAETTKVIGVTRTADGSGNLLTSTANALDINIKSGSIANTSFAATQATASSLNATVTQGPAAALTAGWVAINGEQNDTTGTFTNATQTTSVTATNLAGYGNVLISVNGTYGTATAIFEGSDDGGTTWYTVGEAARTDSNVVESGYTSLTNTTRAWQTNNPGWDSLRVRSTAVASGTVNIRISPSAAPSAAGATVQLGSALPTGANVIGAVTQSGTWTDTVTQVTAANLNATVVGTGTFSVQTTADVPGTGATNLGKAEDAASASGDTGVMVLGVRNDSLTAAQTSANGDYGAMSVDTSGIVITAGAPRALKGRQATTITSSTAETTIITSIASTFLDLYGLVLTNTSAAVTKVSIRDATAGGTITVLEVPATDTRGFMLPLDSAIPQAAVTNNWTAQCGTSVASLEVTALYVKRV